MTARRRDMIAPENLCCAGATDLVRAARPASARHRPVADRGVIVRQLFALSNRLRRADPDCRIDDLEPAVGMTRMIDEPRDVPADRGVTTPRAVDPEDPDATLIEVALLARLAVPITNELAGVIDDSRVLRDGFVGEDAEAVHLGPFSDYLRQLVWVRAPMRTPQFARTSRTVASIYRRP